MTRFHRERGEQRIPYAKPQGVASAMEPARFAQKIGRDRDAQRCSMHRLFMEDLYFYGHVTSVRNLKHPEQDILLYETVHPHSGSEVRAELRPSSDLARRYYIERNPFLSELASTLPGCMIVLPVLAKVDYGFTGFISGRAILEYSLRASVIEILLDSGKLGRLIQLEDGNLLILFQRDFKGENPGILTEKSDIDWAAFNRRRENLKERFRSLWRCGLTLFVGSLVACRDLAAEYEILAALSRESRGDVSLFFERDPSNGRDSAASADFDVWALLLAEGDESALVREITRFLIPLNGRPRNDLSFLLSFQQDFLQMIYTVLKNKDVQAHCLYDEPHAATLLNRACRSVDDMVSWTSYVIMRSTACLGKISIAQSMVDRVRKFVADNIDKDLSRKSIAKRLGMNPDYLARVFKKETGLSIHDFVQNERLDIAKSLLIKTDMSICGIAGCVGYSNFSHFAEAFRKYVGQNPADFRKAAT